MQNPTSLPGFAALQEFYCLSSGCVWHPVNSLVPLYLQALHPSALSEQSACAAAWMTCDDASYASYRIIATSRHEGFDVENQDQLLCRRTNILRQNLQYIYITVVTIPTIKR